MSSGWAVHGWLFRVGYRAALPLHATFSALVILSAIARAVTVWIKAMPYWHVLEWIGQKIEKLERLRGK